MRPYQKTLINFNHVSKKITNKCFIFLLISSLTIDCTTKPNTYTPTVTLKNQPSSTYNYNNLNPLTNLKREYGICGFLSRTNIISIDALKIIGKRYVVNQVNYNPIPNSDYFMFSLNDNEHLDLSEVYVEMSGQSRFINLGQTIDCYAPNSAKALRLK